mgnify:FL=1
MRKVDKRPEPKEWVEYRQPPGAKYEAISELRSSLLEEQGYVCAYCMRRIPVKDRNSNETSRIEHVLSREKHPDRELDYHNMVICCPGAISSDFHCDKLKGNEDLTFNLFDDELFTSLSYKSKSGKIVSANEDYDRQINQLLNLNNRWLMANRLQALLGVIDYLNRKGWIASNLNQQISKWSNMDAEGRYKEYNSIVVWYLKKKQRQCDL